MIILCSSQRVEYQGVNVEGGVMKLSRVAVYVGTHTITRKGREAVVTAQPAAYLRSGDEVFHNISITCENCSSTSNLKLL